MRNSLYARLGLAWNGSFSSKLRCCICVCCIWLMLVSVFGCPCGASEAPSPPYICPAMGSVRASLRSVCNPVMCCVTAACFTESAAVLRCFWNWATSEMVGPVVCWGCCEERGDGGLGAGCMVVVASGGLPDPCWRSCLELLKTIKGEPSSTGNSLACDCAPLWLLLLAPGFFAQSVSWSPEGQRVLGS